LRHRDAIFSHESPTRVFADGRWFAWESRSLHYAARRSKGERKKKPGRVGRDDTPAMSMERRAIFAAFANHDLELRT
jgi:hypothetical protein